MNLFTVAIEHGSCGKNSRGNCLWWCKIGADVLTGYNHKLLVIICTIWKRYFWFFSLEDVLVCGCEKEIYRMNCYHHIFAVYESGTACGLYQSSDCIHEECFTTRCTVMSVLTLSGKLKWSTQALSWFVNHCHAWCHRWKLQW